MVLQKDSSCASTAASASWSGGGVAADRPPESAIPSGVETAVENLFASAALEPYEVVFADPPQNVRGSFGRSAMGGSRLSLGGSLGSLAGILDNDHRSTYEDGPRPFAVKCEESDLDVRDLDTGAMRRIDEDDELSKTFLGVSRFDEDSPSVVYANPSQLARRPWQSWWRDKKSRDELLWQAAAAGNIEDLEAALSAGNDGSAPAQASSRSPCGRTALHFAAGSGSVECVGRLLAVHAEPKDRTPGTGLTALHFASHHGSAAVAEMLLDRGADPVAMSSDGSLPLHLAAANARTDVVSLLLERGGGEQLSVRNDRGQCAAEAATDVSTAAILSDAAAARCEDDASAADGYTRRTRLISEADDGVLLRNARADAVRALLDGARKPACAAVDEEGAAGADEEGDEEGFSPSRPSRPKRSRVEELFRHVLDPVQPDGEGAEEEDDEVVSPDSFELGKVLGQGSFGQVFQVTHKISGGQHAMKILKKNKIAKANLMRYAVTERNVLATVRHPYIVSLHFAFQTSSYLVLVLQLCTGGNLQTLLNREKKLGEPLARLYSAEILLAFCHLHERHILFRDLKPANVVLDDEGHALLTDFGLSKEGVEGLCGTQSFCGSVAFLAPEIILRKGHGHTVDIYGLGVLLFDMLTGLPPFYSRDRDQLYKNIKNAPLRIPRGVSKDASALIRTTMEREPSRRIGAKSTKEVQRHAFFSRISWAALLRREVKVELPQSKDPNCAGDKGSAEAGLDPFAGGSHEFAPPKNSEARAVQNWNFKRGGQLSSATF